MAYEHTPGPWVYHSGMVWKPDESEDGIPIARMDRDTPHTRPVERDANARLIAAAPELLEACKAIVKAVDSEAHRLNCKNPACRICAAKAAIARAEGK